MLSYLCVVNNPNDDLRLSRIINNPPRGLGAKTIDAAQRLDYAILNEGVAEGLAVDDSGYATEQVTAMAYDYTTATMYGLVLPVGSEMGYLASIDLDTGAVTKLHQLDQKVFALAIDDQGTLYAAGSDSYVKDANLYTIDENQRRLYAGEGAPRRLGVYGFQLLWLSTVQCTDDF